MQRTNISIVYYGLLADKNMLDLYDASNSYYGLARTLAIIGHYWATGDIISIAPRSAMPIYILPAEEGSFKQVLAVGVLATVLGNLASVPFVFFATRMMEHWVPADPDPQKQRIIELLEEQNRLLRKDQKLPANATVKEKEHVARIDDFLQKNDKDVQVIRSVTSNSFKTIFRPIGKSANYVGVIGGIPSPPRVVVDAPTLAKIEADEVDDNDRIILGVVNSFSRGSKTGVVWSNDFRTSFRIEYTVKGKLPTQDDFSWSQFRQRPIRMTGRFVRFFDGSVKKFLVFHVERVTKQEDIDDYYGSDREIQSLKR